MEPCVICPLPELCEAFDWHVIGSMWTLWKSPSPHAEEYRVIWVTNANLDLEETRNKFGGGHPGGPEYTTDCIYRGETERRHKCESCGDGWYAPIKHCDVHGECTLFKVQIEGVTLCPCPQQVVKLLV